MSDLNVIVNSPVTKIIEVGGAGSAVAIADLSNRLINSGNYLESLIIVSNAGVSSLNGQSGALNITGVGNTSVTVNSGQIIVSGLPVDTSAFYPNSNPSGFITGDILKFSTTLTSGVDNQLIFYPVPLNQNPQSITCEITNDIDNLIYSHVINGVNISGFKINFSDNLSAAGYQVYTTVLI